MKIIVFGAGALGGYYGGRLLKAGRDVLFYVRKRRAEQLLRNGLSIRSPLGDASIPDVPFITDIKMIEKADLVLLAIKGYHLPDALYILKKLAEKGAKFLPLLNGVAHYRLLERHLGRENLLGGTAYIVSRLDEKGHIIHENAQDLLIAGPLFPEQRESFQSILPAISEGGFLLMPGDPVEPFLWEKYIFITAFSGITTATGLTIGDIRKFPETMEMAFQMLDEMNELANILGISLTGETVDKAKLMLQSLPDDATSSMHRDRMAGNPIELEHIHGAAIRMAAEKGKTLPAVQAIYRLLKPFEKGREKEQSPAMQN